MKKRERTAPGRKRSREPERGAVGLEAEFVCVVDGEAVDPKDAFGDPRAFLGDGALHRVGTSYHLPTGGAVYFDTGVIEVVTPVIELGTECAAQVVRSLWEGVCQVRGRLDEWSEREGRDARMAGFSAHYNVSLSELRDGGRIAAIGRVLTDMLPFPVMLFAANRRSTGVGVRPRPGRIEVTVDFTPDPALMTATTAIIVAAVREVAGWDRVDRAELERRGYPVIAGFEPVPHTSRKGWLARFSCYDPDPFRSSPDARLWRTTEGEPISVRGAARRVVSRLLPRLREMAVEDTRRVIERVLVRRYPSLLDLPDRPESYENVGRLCVWREPDPTRPLGRSAYEQVMLDVMAGRPIEVDGEAYRPVGTRGWTRVRYRSEEGRTRTFSVDELVRLRE
ncbi:MAG TPA: hypothetical protein VMM83_06885 [Longimicrobiales bacterium]|nr:hypothetical protein [Longimicrobiales bacterium]